jgi:hypothetical protein
MKPLNVRRTRFHFGTYSASPQFTSRTTKAGRSGHDEARLLDIEIGRCRRVTKSRSGYSVRSPAALVGRGAPRALRNPAMLFGQDCRGVSIGQSSTPFGTNPLDPALMVQGSQAF